MLDNPLSKTSGISMDAEILVLWRKEKLISNRLSPTFPNLGLGYSM